MTRDEMLLKLLCDPFATAAEIERMVGRPTTNRPARVEPAVVRPSPIQPHRDARPGRRVQTRELAAG